MRGLGMATAAFCSSGHSLRSPPHSAQRPAGPTHPGPHHPACGPGAPGRRQALLPDGGNTDEGPSALQRLVALKTAIRQVSAELMSERHAPQQAVQETDDPLGWTLRLIRALENERLNLCRRCVASYPALAPMVTLPCHSLTSRNRSIGRLRDHAIHLAREDNLAQLQALRQDFPDLQPHEVQARKKRLMHSLARIAPGRTTHFQAVQQAHGRVTAEPARMAAALGQHWSQTFRPRNLHRPTFRWLIGAPTSLPCQPDPRRPSRMDAPQV